MSLPLSMAAYFTIWWVVLFAVLPIGVRSQIEAGDVEAVNGADAGAPAAPMLAKKALWTTLVTALVFIALDVFVYAMG